MAVLAIVLAVGRNAAANGLLTRCFASRTFPQILSGGICGAYLGIRWFRHHHVFWCALESALIGFLATLASSISLVTVDLPAIPPDIRFRPAFLLHVAADLSSFALWGSAFSGVFTLVLVSLGKLIAFSRLTKL